jgi:hypothetical protein
MDFGDSQRFPALQGRQQAGQGLGQPGFSAARRANQQQVMTSSGCEGQGLASGFAVR